MSKFKLEPDYNYDFFLMALCCHEKDYRICWAINNILNTDLRKEKDLNIPQKKGNAASLFSLYFYNDEEQFREYYLVSNKNETSVLIPEQKQADYFMLVKGTLGSNEKEQMLLKIKGSGMVLTAYTVEPGSLRSKQNLIF